MGMHGGRTAWAAVLAMGLAGCSQVSDLAEVGQIGSGLVARTICSGVFVQGRDVDSLWRDELNTETDERLSMFGARVDARAKEVRARAYGFFLSTAVYREGLGCALTPGSESKAMRAATAPAPAPVPHEFETAEAANPAALEAALDWAFSKPESGPEWRTRAVVVLHNGKLVAERYADGFTAETPMYSASMAKTVSAMLVGILEGEGRMDLSTRGLFPEWTDTDRASITPLDLLGMQSGLDFREDYAGSTDVSRMLYAEKSAGGMARSVPAKQAPGTRWAYSSGDTNILMQVARQMSGMDEATWRAFPRKALFDPLGLEHTVFETDAQGDFLGSTYIYASAQDWARLGLLLARDGQSQGRQILPAGWVDRMATPVEHSNLEYGLQTWLHEAKAGEPAPVVSMNGYGGQRVTVRRDTDTVIVRLGWQVVPDVFPQEKFVADIEAALAAPAAMPVETNAPAPSPPAP
jgi:CubicO group peptidase (beta-lactamase class C family)